MISLVVPADHKVLPALPDDSKAYQSDETNASVIEKAKHVSSHKLRQKNRHQRCIEISFPITLQFESGTNYLLQGFGPQIDGKWTCDEVENQTSSKTRVRGHGLVLPATGLHRRPNLKTATQRCPVRTGQFGSECYGGSQRKRNGNAIRGNRLSKLILLTANGLILKFGLGG